MARPRRAPGVDKISFTGSTAVGKQIAATAATRMARVRSSSAASPRTSSSLTPTWTNAVNGVWRGSSPRPGQTCLAGSRVLVHEDIYDDFTKHLVTRAPRSASATPRTRPARWARGEQGPVRQGAAYIEIAKADGRRLAAGGRAFPATRSWPTGLFIEPTVFTDVTN